KRRDAQDRTPPPHAGTIESGKNHNYHNLARFVPTLSFPPRTHYGRQGAYTNTSSINTCIEMWRQTEVDCAASPQADLNQTKVASPLRAPTYARESFGR